MASVRRKTTSPYWFACYYREDGTRTQTTTRTTDRKEALRIADALEQAHARRMTEAQMRRILSDLNERLCGAPLNSATLADYAAQWLERKQIEVEKVTFTAYQAAVNDFVSSTPAKAHIGIQYLTPPDVAAFRDKCAVRTTARTANNKLKIIRTMLQTAWRDGFIPDNPAAKVPRLKEDESIRRPFTLPELKSLLLVASIEWRGAILAGLYTGQRLKDIVTLCWRNIDLEHSEIRLTTSKTRRHQIIPMAKPFEDYLRSLKAGKSDAPVFPELFELVSRDGDVGRVSQQFYELMTSAGLVSERLGKDKSKGVGRSAKRERSELSFHSLRHTATSLLKAAGVPEAVARDIIGHDSEAVSRNYTHVDEVAKRAAMEKMPDVFAAA